MSSLTCMALGSVLSISVLILLLYLAEMSLNIIVDLFAVYQDGVRAVREGTGSCIAPQFLA